MAGITVTEQSRGCFCGDTIVWGTRSLQDNMFLVDDWSLQSEMRSRKTLLCPNFKLEQIGGIASGNSSGKHQLTLSEIELFGTLNV